jgi:hypothetical protein
MGLGSCGTEGSDECDAAEPACESRLVLVLPDERVEFRLRVSDDLGKSFVFDCPSDDGLSFDQDGRTITCQGGEAVVVSNEEYGEVLMVGIGEAPEKTYTPAFSFGSDLCQNVCTSGSVELQ